MQIHLPKAVAQELIKALRKAGSKEIGAIWYFIHHYHSSLLLYFFSTHIPHFKCITKDYAIMSEYK